MKDLIRYIFLVIAISAFTFHLNAAVSDNAQSTNDAEAMYDLALSYASGSKTEKKDEKKAFEYYLKSADAGYSLANYGIARCYAYGKGVKADRKKAFEYYLKAAESSSDNISSMYELALFYYEGKVVEKDDNEAVKWLLKNLSQEGIVISPTTSSARTLLLKIKSSPTANISEDFDAEIMYYTALSYASGSKTEKKDEKKAFEYYLKSADAGYAFANYGIARCYAYGKGVKKDEKKAFEYYLKAADAGYAVANCSIATYYASGKGVKKDEKKAFEYYLKAADARHFGAMCIVASCYASGKVVKKDEKKAFEYYLKAAKRYSYYSAMSIYRMAVYELALCYHEAKGTKKDNNEAVKWLSKIARQDSSSNSSSSASRSSSPFSSNSSDAIHAPARAYDLLQKIKAK